MAEICVMNERMTQNTERIRGPVLFPFSGGLYWKTKLSVSEEFLLGKRLFF